MEMKLDILHRKIQSSSGNTEIRLNGSRIVEISLYLLAATTVLGKRTWTGWLLNSTGYTTRGLDFLGNNDGMLVCALGSVNWDEFEIRGNVVTYGFASFGKGIELDRWATWWTRIGFYGGTQLAVSMRGKLLLCCFFWFRNRCRDEISRDCGMVLCLRELNSWDN